MAVLMMVSVVVVISAGGADVLVRKMDVSVEGGTDVSVGRLMSFG